MFKSLTSFALVCLLLLVSNGVGLHMHFSNGQLYDIAWGQQADSCCPEPCACCQDIAINFDMDVEAVQPQAPEIPPHLLIANIATLVVLTDAMPAPKSVHLIKTLDSPPPEPLLYFLQIFLL